MYKINPVLKHYLWGGEKLITEYKQGPEDSERPVSESWILSVHKDGVNGLVDTDLSLEDIYKQNPSFFGTNCPSDLFPILIKFIDAKQSLSIQVHPDEEYAMKNCNSHGKTEMWYIMDADEGSFIYYGLKDGVSKEAFEESIKNNTVLDLLNKVYVKPGDYYLIEAGTIHAIGEGLLICEIQQNSNITYRVYDYNRKDKDGKTRELHVDKSLEVIDFVGKNHYISGHVSGNHCEMIENDIFKTDYYNIDSDVVIDNDLSSFRAISVLSGNGFVKHGDEEIKLVKGDSVVVEASDRQILVGGEIEFIVSKAC